MTHYIHTLTDIEEACGVTLEDVARELPRGLFIADGTKFVVDDKCSPALAGSVARCAFGGDGVEFLGTNSVGMLVYGRS